MYKFAFKTIFCGDSPSQENPIESLLRRNGEPKKRLRNTTANLINQRLCLMRWHFINSDISRKQEVAIKKSEWSQEKEIKATVIRIVRYSSEVKETEIQAQLIMESVPGMNQDMKASGGNNIAEKSMYLGFVSEVWSHGSTFVLCKSVLAVAILITICSAISVSRHWGKIATLLICVYWQQWRCEFCYCKRVES